MEKTIFAIEVTHESETKLSDKDVDALFEQRRKNVAAVQKQQMRVLRK